MTIFIVILVNVMYISILVYLLITHGIENKPKEKTDIYDKPLDIGPTLTGYIYDKEVYNTRLIISDILDMIKKKYILVDISKKEIIGNDYILSKNIEKENDLSSLKKHEQLVYNYIFKEDDKNISLYSISRKISNTTHSLTASNYSLIYSHKILLEERLRTDSIIDAYDEKKLKEFNIISKLSILVAIIFFFINIYAAFFIMMWSVFISLFTTHKKRFTDYGVNLRENIKEYRDYLYEDFHIEDKEIDKLQIWSNDYIYGIAFGISIPGIEEYIPDMMLNWIELDQKSGRLEKTKEIIESIMLGISVILIALLLYIITPTIWIKYAIVAVCYILVVAMIWSFSKDKVKF